MTRLALPLLAVLGCAATAHAAVFQAVPPDAAHVPAALAARTAAHASLLRLDAGDLAAFRAAGGGALSIPTVDGELRLDLHPWNLLGDGQVTVTDASGRHAAGVDVTLYRGTIAGEPDGWAVIAASPDGVQGVFSTRAGRSMLSPVEPPRPGFAPLHAIRPENAGDDALARDWVCGVDGASEAALRQPEPSGRAPGETSAQLTTTLLQFAVAVDCDEELLGTKFAGDLTNATSYMLALLGSVSLIYERDLDVQLTYPYLNFWATTDPYTQSTTTNQLPEFRDYWNANMGSVNRSIAHLISGRALGGGIAYVTALCGASGYAVSAIDAVYTYPTNSTTWDLVVVAHEIGHNFGSSHTHSCFWQSAGYLPAGALIDTCRVSEGGCNVSTPRVPFDKGTIMSYCHLAGGINAIRLDFHPICISRMRTVAEGAVCRTVAAFQPPRNLAASPTSTGALLSWTASPASGVLGYEVSRSLTQLDLGAPVIAAPAATSQPDSGFGTFFYRVRALRTGETSEWSGEKKITLCGLGVPVAYPTGTSTSPVAIAGADLDADGILDLVTADFSAGKVSVLMGQGTGGVGDGTYAAPVQYTTGAGASGVLIADWNGDGRLDLAVCNQSAQNVSILLGQGTGPHGDGTFAAGTTIPNVPAPAGMAMGDFNEDGILDLVAVGSGTSAQILLGQGAGGVGNGTFVAGESLLGNSSPQAVAVADFNHDGIADLAVVGSLGARIFLGDGANGKGDGTFTQGNTYNCGVGPGSVVTTDWNGDGETDLGVGATSAGTIAILLGAGDGTFAPAVSYPAGGVPYGLQCADWDGDGVPDAAVANSSAANTASVLVSDHQGGLTPGTLGPAFPFSAGNSPRNLLVADANEDGAPDMLVVNRVGNAVSVLTGSCATPLPTSLHVTSPDGGEQWAVDEEHAITWEHGDGVFAVNVQVSRDGGGHWQTIAENVTGSSFAWTVTEPVGPQVRVRVVDPVFANRNDASDADFEVKPAVILDAPGAPAAALSLSGAHPNPARHRMTVTFTLPDDRPATLELIDLAGRRVTGAPIVARGAGTHQTALAPARPLRAGLYLVRLRHPAGERSLKVAFLE